MRWVIPILLLLCSGPWALAPPALPVVQVRKSEFRTKGAFLPFAAALVLKNPPGSIKAVPQTALTRKAQTGGDYDVFHFEFFVDFPPHELLVLVSTNLVDWILWHPTSGAVGQWSRDEIIREEMYSPLFVRVCASNRGWWDLPVRLGGAR